LTIIEIGNFKNLDIMTRLINEIPVKFTDVNLENKLITAQTLKIKCIKRLQQLHSMQNLDMFQINEVQELLEKINRSINVLELQIQ